MKTKHIIATALTGLMTLPAIAEESSTPTTGDILRSINMFTPEEGAPAYKVKPSEKFGTEWALDMAYGYWGTNNAMPGTNGKNNYFLLHGQLNQRLIEDAENGGTWLRFEISGSVALDATTRRQEGEFIGGYGTINDVHGDIFWPHKFILPELAIMHYFAGQRACIIAGMVNLTNYFDAVSIANDSFSGFTNTGFMNSAILPLVDSNLGAVLQVELNYSNYVMAAVSRTDCESGYNPFDTHGSGYCIVGEWGHIVDDGKLILRVNPFFQSIEQQTETGTKARKNAGLVASIEYTPCDYVTLFTRAGFSAKQELGNSAEFSVGANLKLIPGREDDFFGIAWGVYKGQNSPEEPTAHNRESTLELMYSFQVNDYIKVVPHFQYIHNPSYRDDCRDETIFGIQTVFSF